MSILVYLILGWFIGELFHFTLWEFTKHKLKLDNKKLKSIFIFVGIALLILLISSGFYRVQSYENVIVTSVTGNKIVKDTTGIKYSLLSSRQTIDLRKQIMKFPESVVGDGKIILTKDNKPILATSFIDYQITNTKKWGLENKNSERKLYILLSSQTLSTLQRYDYNYISNNKQQIQKEIEKELKSIENEYGIKIIEFRLIILDTLEVQQAKSNAESNKIKSKSLIDSYKSESEALKTKYNSITDKEFIKYMEFIKAIKEGKINTILVPSNNIPVVDLK